MGFAEERDLDGRRMRFVLLDWIRLHCIRLYCIALNCIGVNWIALLWIRLHSIALHCFALNWIELHRIALHSIREKIETRAGRGGMAARAASLEDLPSRKPSRSVRGATCQHATASLTVCLCDGGHHASKQASRRNAFLSPDSTR